VGEKLAEIVGQNVPESIHISLEFKPKLDENAESLFFYPTHAEEECEIINQFEASHASASDDLSPALLKECKKHHIHPFVQSINKSLSTGVVPKTQKVAKGISSQKKEIPQVLTIID